VREDGRVITVLIGEPDTMPVLRRANIFFGRFAGIFRRPGDSDETYVPITFKGGHLGGRGRRR
jgi:hypothetical protein